MSRLDDPLVRSVEDASLPAAAFHHREHVYVTWCYLTSLPLEEALLRVTRVLRSFATAHGHAAHYHATMTWAHVLLVHEVLSRDPEQPFEVLLERVAHGRAAIAALYGERLSTAEARARFCLPSAIVGPLGCTLNG